MFRTSARWTGRDGPAIPRRPCTSRCRPRPRPDRDRYRGHPAPRAVRPRSGGVGGRDDQVSAALAAVGDDQPEAAVVVAQGGGVDPAGGRHGGGQAQLFRPVQDIADLRPVHQVTAVEEGHPGEVLEAGAGQVVVVADAADAGVGVEAGDHGVRGVGDASVRLAQRGHPRGPLVDSCWGRGVVQEAPASVGVMRSRTADGAVGRVRLSSAVPGIQAETATADRGVEQVDTGGGVPQVGQVKRRRGVGAGSAPDGEVGGGGSAQGQGDPGVLPGREDPVARTARRAAGRLGWPCTPLPPRGPRHGPPGRVRPYGRRDGSGRGSRSPW
ncbi:hypothetical protein SAFG77S_10059 [Streptomyces afghaniensis]